MFEASRKNFFTCVSGSGKVVAFSGRSMTEGTTLPTIDNRVSRKWGVFCHPLSFPLAK
jgi:hypothetical protein